jgi:hypothetical protein
MHCPSCYSCGGRGFHTQVDVQGRHEGGTREALAILRDEASEQM